MQENENRNEEKKKSDNPTYGKNVGIVFLVLGVILLAFGVFTRQKFFYQISAADIALAILIIRGAGQRKDGNNRKS